LAEVTEVERAGQGAGRPRLSFTFHEVRVDGSREDVRTHATTYVAETTSGEDAAKVGTGAIGAQSSVAILTVAVAPPPGQL
jgi:hypothetical protein